MRQVSVVIPVLNEADALNELYAQLSGMAETHRYAIEMIFVDDGSTDESWEVIKQLADQDHRVKGRRFRRNFGKAAAIRAGVAAATSEWIATMDADLQDDPNEIPVLAKKLEAGFDLVNGWKQNRQDAWTRRVSSRLFNVAVNWLTGVTLHDHNCGLKVARREVFDEIVLYGDRHRFIPVLAAARGFRVGEAPVGHRARPFGKSKYGWSRLPTGILDILTVAFLTSFNHRPQHLIGTIGLSSFLVGLFGMMAMVVYWIVRMVFFAADPHWVPLHQRPVVIYSVAIMLLGAQLLCLGFLAELIAQRTGHTEDPFSIQEEIGPTKSNERS
ncbi:MAG TPA: glycosyltransferase family 2 protein [Pirellulaceae bacterium]|nr:glycosyltransferase family 2 protein [Pirellulaceae bacterium]